jgi:hypothetical protein
MQRVGGDTDDEENKPQPVASGETGQPDSDIGNDPGIRFACRFRTLFD